MAVITLPASLSTATMKWGQRRFDMNFSSGDAGTVQARVLAPPRWTLSFTAADALTATQAADWRAMILDMDGQVNQLAVYDFGNPIPQGTANSGSWTMNATATAGATSMQINLGVGNAGKTLLKGDWVGVNQSAISRQLLHVQSNATADGSGIITISFKPFLRVGVTSGTSVVYNQPTALFRRSGADTQWSHDGAVRGGYSLDLVESWEP